MIESLRFQGLSFQYEPTSPLLKEIDFEFPMNTNVHISGYQGTGRSAILKLLAALVRPTGGTYYLNDQSVTDMGFEEFLPFRKRIGFCCDFGGLLANKTLAENLMLPLVYHNFCPFDEAQARVESLLARFGLLRVKNLRPASASGWMRKACVVARSFVLEPEMLLMDDPTVGLDQAASESFFEILDEQRKSKNLKHLFFTTRDERMVERLKPQTVLIHEQALKGNQTPRRKAASE